MANPEVSEVRAPSVAPTKKDTHIAVVFFHGIGQQRRYEMTSQLLESLDDWVFAGHRSGDPDYEIPRLDIKTRCELLRGGNPSEPEQSVVYLQADYHKTRVRFYEGYWAPATVLGTTAVSVLSWVIRQLPRPLEVLRAPWRSYARLRRGDLLRSADYADEERVRQLISLYRRFVAQREVRKGTFREFVQFIEKSNEADAKDLVVAARQWHRRHLLLQLRHAAGLAFFALTGASVFALIVLGLVSLLATVSTVPQITNWVSKEALEPSLKNALALLSLLLAAFGVSALVRDYAGDIQQFVTYEEAQPLYERRKKILDMAESTLRHLLLDPKCERVVVVSHSLGTAVALDAMLRLRTSNQAADPSADAAKVMSGPLPLARIQHFITCGSPIDKINYFFAALRSTSRSYESLIEGLRGDISRVPFSRSGRQPYIHWINFWDRGDPISGSIETVAGDVLREQRVDNVQVVSYLWPDPAASHEGYFRHRDVIKTIFEAAFKDGFTFAHLKTEPGKRPEWPWLGPGVRSASQAALLLLWPLTAALVIWTAVASLVPALTAPTGTIGVAVAILFLLLQAQRRLRLHRAPLQIPPRRVVGGELPTPQTPAT